MKGEKAIVRAALHAGSWYTQSRKIPITQKPNLQKK